MVTVTDHRERYLLAFAQAEPVLMERGPGWLHGLRREAIAHFKEIGFPDRRVEEWRFTNIRPIVEQTFVPAEKAPRPISQDLFQLHAYAEHCHLITFINGFYSPELSDLGDLPENIIVQSLSEAWQERESLLEPHIARKGSFENNPFAALNTAFMQDGVFIHLPKDTVVEKPIHILYFSATAGEPGISYPRNLIVAGSSSRATVIESYVGQPDQIYFTNAFTEVVAGDSSNLQHVRLQRESLNAYHISSTQLYHESQAHFATHNINLGGSIVRHDINSYLDGEFIESTLNGLYMLDGIQHVDNHTVIYHNQPNCNSHELYKGVLNNRSRGVFRGRIYVAPHAQKTDSKQSNNVLLLSDQAEITSMPQLEIYADDVKCTHGATTGEIDENALFYLRSRGIPYDEAKGLMIYAFASEIVDQIPLEFIQDQLHKDLFNQLPMLGLEKE
ncbi:MAG: Fe-S cluster assembly protein SufD [bacterium]